MIRTESEIRENIRVYNHMIRGVSPGVVLERMKGARAALQWVLRSEG